MRANLSSAIALDVHGNRPPESNLQVPTRVYRMQISAVVRMPAFAHQEQAGFAHRLRRQRGGSNAGACK